MLHFLAKVSQPKDHNLAKKANLQFFGVFFFYIQECRFLYSSHYCKIHHTHIIEPQVLLHLHCCNLTDILSSKDLYKDLFGCFSFLLGQSDTITMFWNPPPPELRLTPFLCRSVCDNVQHRPQCSQAILQHQSTVSKCAESNKTNTDYNWKPFFIPVWISNSDNNLKILRMCLLNFSHVHPSTNLHFYSSLAFKKTLQHQ